VRYLHWLRIGFVFVCGLSAEIRADIASLTVTGPETGSAMSNPGVIAKERFRGPQLLEALVTIHLKPGANDDLVADCHGVFTLL